jgi:hypothetical protein
MTTETIDFLNHLSTQVVLAIACYILYRDLQGKLMSSTEENTHNIAQIVHDVSTIARQLQILAQSLKITQAEIVELAAMNRPGHFEKPGNG